MTDPDPKPSCRTCETFNERCDYCRLELQAQRTCDECGEHATTTTNDGGTIRHFCDVHYSQHITMTNDLIEPETPERTPIKCHHIYDHPEYGEVVVGSISAVFAEYDPADPPTVDELTPVVRFYTAWDDFGPLSFDPTARHRERADEFAEKATHLRKAEYEVADGE